MMTTSSINPSACPHCGMRHTTTCPRIRKIEYHADGTTKSVEFHAPQPIVGGHPNLPMTGPIDWSKVSGANPPPAAQRYPDVKAALAVMRAADDVVVWG